VYVNNWKDAMICR